MLANTGRMTTDPIPNIRAAGKVIAMGGEGTETCIKPETYGAAQAPGTPEHIRRYRKS